MPHVERAIKVITDIMDDTTAPKTSRLQAAGMVLDRKYGKPTVKLHETKIVTLQDTLTDIARKNERYQAVVDAEIVEPKRITQDKDWGDLI
jgi:hypothetical protein